MKKYSADQIRNITLVAHGGVGKTSLAEAMLYTAKSTAKPGSVDNGTSLFDSRADEKDRKMTISTAVGFCEWNNAKVNVIDTPGFLDFIGEMNASLRVSETAVILVDASDGIQVGTELGYRNVDAAGCARLFYVNAMDKENADFQKVTDALKESFGTSVAPLVIPVGAGQSFRGVVDLVTKEAFEYTPDSDGSPKKIDIPADVADTVESARLALMEAVAESDEELLNAFFENGELSDEELRNGVAAGVNQGLIYPVLAGSAVHNIGVDQLLYKITNLCPSAASVSELEIIEGGETKKIAAGEDQPFVGMVFKTISEDHLGEISICRAFSGTLQSGSDIQNTTTGVAERCGALQLLKGHDRTETDAIGAGDIFAMLKLKDTHTGNTLADKKQPVQLSPILFPEPLVSIAISAAKKGDDDKISVGLAKLHEEDPSFTYKFHSDIHQSILSAMGDIHLEVILSQLKARFKVEVERKKPKISYRETISKPVKYVEYTHKKQTGGAGQYARVFIDLEPAPRGEGYEFLDKIVGGVIDQPLRPSVDKGIRAKMDEGIMAGYPIVDVKASLVDGKTHPVDSKDVAFQIAGREVFKKAFEMASPVILEPVVDLKVVVPDEYTGDVMGDISSRRGRISGMEPEGKYQVINAKVPASEVQTYSQSLRSFTQGRGFYSLAFSHYEPVPPDVAQKIIAESKAEAGAD
jgi:elongation factor G